MNPMSRQQLRLVAHENLSKRNHSPVKALEELQALGFKQCHWVVDTLSMTVDHVGRYFEQIFGMSPHVMETDPAGFLVRVHPEDRESLVSHIQTAIEHAVDLEIRLLDGKELKWVWLRSFPVENEDLFCGTRMLFVVEDITSSRGRARKQG
jgi:hypothetical protein